MNISDILIIISNLMNRVLFFEVFHIPILILGFISAGLFFTIKLGFPNIRMFKHGLDVAFKNKYYSVN